MGGAHRGRSKNKYRNELRGIEQPKAPLASPLDAGEALELGNIDAAPAVGDREKPDSAEAARSSPREAASEHSEPEAQPT